MAKKKEFVTHKVVKERQYNVFKIDGMALVLLATLTSATRPHETELCKQYDVKKVVVQEVDNSTKYETYAMPLDKFMEQATKLSETAGEADKPDSNKKSK